MDKIIGNISSIQSNGSGDISSNSSKINGNLTHSDNRINGNITFGLGVGSKVVDYDVLINKPQIESVELEGNKTFEELGLTGIDVIDILDILI